MCHFSTLTILTNCQTLRDETLPRRRQFMASSQSCLRPCGSSFSPCVFHVAIYAHGMVTTIDMNSAFSVAVCNIIVLWPVDADLAPAQSHQCLRSALFFTRWAVEECMAVAHGIAHGGDGESHWTALARTARRIWHCPWHRPVPVTILAALYGPSVPNEMVTVVVSLCSIL